MLIADLLKQEFRKGFRSQAFYRGLAVKLFMGFMTLYFAAIFITIGFSLGKILEEVHDTRTPLELINGASVYIILAALTIRFFMQSLNTLNLQAYQSLPVKRSTLVNFILLKPLFSIGNYLTLLVIIPFAVRSVSAWHSGWVALQFVVVCILIIWMDIWLASYLKRRFGSDLRAFVVILLILAGVAALEYFKVFSVFGFSMKIFGFVMMNPLGLVAALIVSGMAYGLNLMFFSKNYYPEKFNEKLSRGENKVTGGFSFLEKYGTIGELIQLQIRLIFRHKRTKSLIYMSAVFMLYGLLFYTNEMYSGSPAWLIFCGLIVTGMASLTYGQWVISWESNYFDAILTKNIPAKTYIKVNYFILIAFNVISFLLSTPYLLMGTKFFFLHVAMFLFNTGINAFLLIFTATFNNKRIDLSARSMFNYQGTTYKSFLIILPVMFFPMLITFILANFLSFNMILLVLGLLGLAGVVSIPYQMKLCTQQFVRRKYALAEGFRESE